MQLSGSRIRGPFDLIAKDSGVGAIRSYGRTIEGVAYPRKAAAMEIQKAMAFEINVYVISCYDGLGEWFRKRGRFTAPELVGAVNLL